jgi:pSer/pThr/pTyr-binding forkhead associated (FHA) protein
MIYRYLKNPQTNIEYQIPPIKNEMFLGRAPKEGLRIPNKGDIIVLRKSMGTPEADEHLRHTSRTHAKLTLGNVPGETLLTDIGSKYGTFVNGKKIAKDIARTIKDGSKIRFGRLELVYHETES